VNDEDYADIIYRCPRCKGVLKPVRVYIPLHKREVISFVLGLVAMVVVVLIMEGT